MCSSLLSVWEPFAVFKKVEEEEAKKRKRKWQNPGGKMLAWELWEPLSLFSLLAMIYSCSGAFSPLTAVHIAKRTKPFMVRAVTVVFAVFLVVHSSRSPVE